MSRTTIERMKAEVAALTPPPPARRTKQTIDAEKHLRNFIPLVWPLCDPHKFVPGRHIDALAEHLQAVSEGQIKNLLVNIPPRTAKSTIVAVIWPAWEWANRPQTQMLMTSYAASLAIRDAVKSRALMEQPWFRERWGHLFTMTPDQNLKTRYENSRHGYRIAAGVDGTNTGDGGDIIGCDDPHSVSEAESDAVRESTLERFDNTFFNRVNHPRTGRRVIVGQRVHERDLSAHVLRRGGWVHLNLQMEFERKCTTSIGWSDWRTKPGELLWPEFFGPTEISETKAGMTSTAYSAQYQQSPTPPGGTLFKAEWLRYWRKSDDGSSYLLLQRNGAWKSVEIKKCRRFAMMDVAGTEKSEKSRDPDFSVVQVWDITPDNDMVLIDQSRGQAEIPVVQDAAARICRLYDTPYLLVEENNMGKGVAQALRLAGIAIKGITARGDKVSRSQTAQIRMERGSVYFPEGPEWVQRDLVPELLKFPRVPHDDQVDVISYGAQHVQQMTTTEIRVRCFQPGKRDGGKKSSDEHLWQRIG